MRSLSFSEGLSQMEEVRSSTHSTKQNFHGTTHEFLDNGRGKVQNSDYETLHYKDI